MKITVVNKVKGAVRLHNVEQEQIIADIRNGKYQDIIDELRTELPYIKLMPGDEPIQTFDARVLAKIPFVCFAAQFRTKDRQREMTEYNGLVLLEINNLPDIETAATVRNQIARIPYTMVAFIGANGKDVNLVCRATRYDGTLPQNEAEAQQFQTAAFAKLHYTYTNDLQMNIENREPRLDRECLMSADAGIVFHPDAEPMRVDVNGQIPQVQPRIQLESNNTSNTLPSMNRYQTEDHVFEACLEKAYDELLLAPTDDMEYALISLLAKYCCESGLPKAVALNKCKYKKWYGNHELTAREIFNDTYRDRELPFCPTRHISRPQLLIMKTENFMRTHYELRKNVLTGIAQYRNRASYNYGWSDITDDVRNTMTIQAQSEGIDSWDKDISRFLNSTLVSQYDPLADWLAHLPAWDGKDRVPELAARIPTDNPLWEKNLHTWMLSMVAHWMGKDTEHGNAIVPLLIGYQGCGKTTFCSQLLPPELRMYYSDNLNFKNDTSLLLALSSYALINIDEFDKITKSQQPILKYLLSKSDVKLRMPYGQSMEEHRRYASFIATTNNVQPLMDDTGSRRFVCVKVIGQIDTTTAINYAQLYAQLLKELNDGKRYWLNAEETQANMDSNAEYQRTEGLDELITSIFRHPKNCEKEALLNMAEIITTIKHKIPNIQSNDSMARRIGFALSRLNFKKCRKGSGNMYYIVEKASTDRPI